MPRTLETLMETPIGALRLLAEDDALVGIDFVGRAAKASSRAGPVEVALYAGDHPVLAQARRQLAEYFAGERTAFELPLRARGTDFQERVWATLAGIPYGQTRSYREIAVEIGRPGAVRAVGAANGRNPIPIVIPCHRVIGADGSLTGYGGGMAIKTWLLRHERAVVEARGEPLLRAQ
jgi:methylated-DNA-[protein]-cysteine S-methyltransferase